MLEPRMVAASTQALASFAHGAVATVDRATISSRGVLMPARSVFHFALHWQDQVGANANLCREQVAGLLAYG